MVLVQVLWWRHHLLSKSTALHKFLSHNLVLQILIYNGCIKLNKVETFYFVKLLRQYFMANFNMLQYFLLFTFQLPLFLVFCLFLSQSHYLTFVVGIQIYLVKVKRSSKYLMVCIYIVIMEVWTLIHFVIIRFSSRYRYSLRILLHWLRERFQMREKLCGITLLCTLLTWK